MKKPPFGSDFEHQKELERTGFWGKQAAGCLFQSSVTGRICIAHRSRDVEQPGTWGTWGGAMDKNESPKTALRREVKEEAGYKGKYQLFPMYVFRHKSGFVYHNFLAVVEKEFKPTLDWETQGYDWVTYGEWPKPLHEGLKLLLRHPPSIKLMKENAIPKSIPKNKSKS